MLSFFLSSPVSVGKLGINRRCHAEAAGYRQDLSGGVGRFIGGEVHRRGGHLLGLPHAPQWNMTDEQLSEVVTELFLYRIGGGHAGQYGIAADAVFGLLYGNQPGQLVDGRFAGTVADLRNVGHLPSYR